MNRLTQAIRLAQLGHRSQYRKFPGPSGLLRPYIEHPAAVASYVALYDESDDIEEATILAWLHDLIEDTQVKAQYIALMFGKPMARLVSSLSRYRGQDEESYLVQLRASEPAAKLVKGCDILHNLRDSWHAPAEFRARTIGKAEGYHAALRLHWPGTLDADILREIDKLKAIA